MYPHEAIDAIYHEARSAVDNEISQVDDLFLLNAAKEGRLADEIELTSLLYEREDWEFWQQKQQEIEESKIEFKKDLLDHLN